MSGAIYVILISNFMIKIILAFGMGFLGVTNIWIYMFLPLLLAGYFGTNQFRRVQMRFMRMSERFYCALVSSIWMAVLPVLVALLVIFLDGGTVNADALREMSGITAEISTALFITTFGYLLYSVPTIFVGLTIGQMLSSRR